MKNKTKGATIAIMILLTVFLTAISPARAPYETNRWWEYWHQENNYEPVNITSSTIVYSPNMRYAVRASMDVSIYEYRKYFGEDTVTFRVAVYIDSYDNDPDPHPIVTDYAEMYIDKDLNGSNLNCQWMEIELYPSSTYAQGRYMAQHETSIPNPRTAHLRCSYP